MENEGVSRGRGGRVAKGVGQGAGRVGLLCAHRVSCANDWAFFHRCLEI